MKDNDAATLSDGPPGSDDIERLQGHGIICRGDVHVLEADYDVIITPARLRGTGATYEAGVPGHEPTNVPDITGRLLGPLYQAQPLADEVHTLVLEDGREFDFSVLQPDTNEIVGVSLVRWSPASRSRTGHAPS